MSARATEDQAVMQMAPTIEACTRRNQQPAQVLRVVLLEGAGDDNGDVDNDGDDSDHHEEDEDEDEERN